MDRALRERDSGVAQIAPSDQLVQKKTWRRRSRANTIFGGGKVAGEQ